MSQRKLAVIGEHVAIASNHTRCECMEWTPLRQTTIPLGIRLMHLCEYHYADVVLTLAYASVYFRSGLLICACRSVLQPQHLGEVRHEALLLSLAKWEGSASRSRQSRTLLLSSRAAMSSSPSEPSAMDEEKTQEAPPPPSPSGHSARKEEKAREEEAEASDSDTSTEVASSNASPKAPETAVSEPRSSPERSPSKRSHRSQRSRRSRRPRRSRRSRSRRSRSRRSRGRTGGAGVSNRHTINCWHGRACTRYTCWFNHPDGREIDEKPIGGKGGKSGKGKGKGRGGKNLPCTFRRRSKTPCRRRSPQSSSQSRTRSPRRRRSLSRSPSQKQPAPRRLTPALSATSAAEAPTETVARAHSKDAELKAKEARAAKPSFRDFVLKHVSNEDSPDFVMNRFQQYIQERLKEELPAIKETGLFFDLYHPLSRLRRHELHLGTTQLNATTFAQDLREGRYCELSLQTSQARRGTTCPVAGHLQAPEFAFDPDVGSLVIRSLPPAVSVWDVLDAIQDRPGFCTAAWTRFEGKDLARDFFARFTSKEDATAAAVVLMRSTDTLLSRPGSEGTGRASVLSQQPDLSALMLPEEMSLPERLLKDLALSEQVMQRLDGLTEVPKDITALVLNAYGTTEFKLDLRVTYLRRVHHFCFYSARWCDDEWSLRDACGIATLRAPAQAECRPGEWSAAHEQRLESFLHSVSFDKPAAAPDYTNAHVVQRLAEEREKAILKVTDEKFKCKLCGKHFRGVDFVRKHVGRAPAAVGTCPVPSCCGDLQRMPQH
ncbi:unnamed protein product [Symbiodinium sp. CCMP2592]|nr:unnamed protein product [Symbiodinium sp. CCMP2592]